MRIVASLILMSMSAFAQKPDSLPEPDTVRSTFPNIQTQTDTSRRTPSGAGGVDTTIYYGADTTEGTLDNSTMILKNNAWVRYRGMKITAARITIDQPKRLMTAEAVADSIDSTGQVVRWRGIPEFSEGSQSFTGNVMEYNFDTKRGKVVLGQTKENDGFYYGETIRKIGDSTLYVSGGRFTTCDVPDHPHFFFRTREMKLIIRDQVVARPVVLYIHEVPIFAIPFGVFPNRSGRQSGITPPVYSETPREGRQVRNFGYYWAPSDYFDALFQIDFLDKAGWLYHGGVNYAKRYHYTGNARFSYSSLNYITGERTRLWNIDATHNHTISDKSNLSADLHFVSSKNFYQFTSLNQNDILNRQVRSNVLYNRNFEWGSMSANASQSKNLDNGARDYTFPSVTLNKSSAAFFQKPEDERNRPDRWYEVIRYSYNSNALHRGSQANDTAQTLSAIGMNHNASITAPYKAFTWFNIAPSISFQETWFDRRIENYRYDASNQLQSDTVRGFFARHTFSTSVGVSTKLYGIANPNIFGLQTFRHVMTPSVSLTYQPDFSEKGWGYYERAVDTSGNVNKFDRYRGSILFGGTPQGRSLSMGLSLSNVFQAKFLQAASDSAQEPTEKKMDLLNWNSSISYNFEADEFKLSPLSTSLTLSNDLARNVSLNATLVHDFYRYDTLLNRRVNNLQKIPRLTNLSLTAGFSLQGGETSATSDPTGTPSGVSTNNIVPPGYTPQFLPQTPTLPGGVPWNARIDLNYDLNKSNPENVTKNLGANISAGLRISPNWQVNYTARIDVLKKDIISQSYSFVRDLHCWEMRLDWTPTGPAAGYFFIIQIKSPTLRDIKLQKTDYGSRIFN